MSVLSINTSTDDLFYEQLTQLEGVSYLFSFHWLEREGAWYFNLMDQDRNMLAAGIRIVVGFPLLRRFKDERLPPGLMIAIDESKESREIEQPSDLGTRVVLIYFTSDDEVFQ